MSLRILRFITLTLISLSMGVAFAHALELVPKMQYDASLYLTLHRSLYPLFGGVGGPIEAGAVIAAIVLVFAVRKSPAFFLTALGALCMLAAHVIFWTFIFQTNNTMASWPIDAPPPGWTQLRNQWEYSHLMRFFLQLFGLMSIQLSILRETSATATGTQHTEKNSSRISRLDKTA